MAQCSGDAEHELMEILPSLKRFCVSLTRTGHDADDLLQATVLRLLEKPAPPNVVLVKWAFRVCKNIWIDELRSRKVRRAASFDESKDAAGTDGERAMMDRILFEQVHDSMNQLPDDQRVVVSLVAVEGFSYKEAAEILEVPIGTVMSRLSRARNALAQWMERSEASLQNG